MNPIDLGEHLEQQLCRLGVGVDERLILAVSGGADSVALLRAAVAVRAVDSVAVVHVDHGLRPDSAADAAWVAELCTQFNLFCRVERCDVAAIAAGRRVGLEEAARTIRYKILEQAATERDCRFVATGHTADDQTETVLFQMLRGGSWRALRGMSPMRSLASGCELIRPLLNITRVEILQYLETLGQGYCEDSTNTSDEFSRNRIRHEALPLLRDIVNPGVDRALQRLARQTAEIGRLLEELARDLLCKVILAENANSMRLCREMLSAVPAALLPEIFAQIWIRNNWPRQRMRSVHWERLTRMCLDGGRASFPGGVEVIVQCHEVVLARAVDQAGEH